MKSNRCELPGIFDGLPSHRYAMVVENGVATYFKYPFRGLNDLFRRRKINESKALIALTSCSNYTKSYATILNSCSWPRSGE